jgi:polysaccharide export outer membrane protein
MTGIRFHFSWLRFFNLTVRMRKSPDNPLTRPFIPGRMKSGLSVLLWICFFSVLLSPAGEAGEYIIGSDDILQINVYREEELNRKVKVSSDGQISFPLIGKVKVEGFTVPELEKLLNEKLREYLKQPHVTVFIEKYGSFSIIGAVNKPGSYPLEGAVTVLQAISLAGGFTPIASPGGVKILRKEGEEEKVIEVDVGAITRGGDMSKDIPLQRGDTVVVPESFF